MLQKFVDAVISLNALAPAAQTDNDGDGSVGCAEQQLLACLQLIIGCSHMLPTTDEQVNNASSPAWHWEGGALDTAIRILLNATPLSETGTETGGGSGGGSWEEHCDTWCISFYQWLLRAAAGSVAEAVEWLRLGLWGGGVSRPPAAVGRGTAAGAGVVPLER